jgi:hypothetical protein
MAQTAVDLADAAFGGLIREDVMNQIWQIDNIPLPLSDRIGTDSHKNQYAEWTTDTMGPIDIDNGVLDGADASKTNSTVGARIGNHSQISTKDVEVSERAGNVDTIGYANALTYQVSQRQKDLRQDVEAIMLTSQASVKSADAAVPRSAGLGAWIVDATAVANGTTEGGFGATTGDIVDARTGATSAGALALAESDIRAVSKLVYEEGGESTVLMSTPSVVKEFSEYLFTSSARVAALQSDVNQQGSPVTATGAVNVFVSDFSTLEIVSNRKQQVEDGPNAVSVYLLDPGMLRLSFLSGWQVKPLAKNGLADRRQMSVDWTLKVLNPSAQGMIANVDQNTAAVA